MKSDILMNKLRALADGQTVFRMLDELNNLTLDVIASVSLFEKILIFNIFNLILANNYLT